MRRVELDGRDMDSRAKLHRVLKEAFAFPDHYGNNLDALSDCLFETGDVQVVLRYPEAMINSLGRYGQQVLAILEAQARARSDFRFRMVRGR